MNHAVSPVVSGNRRIFIDDNEGEEIVVVGGGGLPEVKLQGWHYENRYKLEAREIEENDKCGLVWAVCMSITILAAAGGGVLLFFKYYDFFSKYYWFGTLMVLSFMMIAVVLCVGLRVYCVHDHGRHYRDREVYAHSV